MNKCPTKKLKCAWKSSFGMWKYRGNTVCWGTNWTPFKSTNTSSVKTPHITHKDQTPRQHHSLSFPVLYSLQNRLPLIFIPPTANIHRLEQTAHGQHWHLSSPGCLKLSESLYCFMQLRLEFFSGTAGEFSSPGSTFCADSYFGIRFTPVLPQ